MKFKISSSEEYGTVLTLTSEKEEEAQALKDLWNRHAGLESFEVKSESEVEIEIATRD